MGKYPRRLLTYGNAKDQAKKEEGWEVIAKEESKAEEVKEEAKEGIMDGVKEETKEELKVEEAKADEAAE